MSTVLFWQPQRLSILGPGMCLSVLPASSYSRCCCSSVRLISTRPAHLFHTGELFILFSMADLGVWDMFPGRCLPPYFLLLFIKLESIVTKLEFPELLKELHLWGRLLSDRNHCWETLILLRAVGGGPPEGLELWKRRPVWSGTPGHEMKL